jgi:hypothetical protein
MAVFLAALDVVSRGDSYHQNDAIDLNSDHNYDRTTDNI